MSTNYFDYIKDNPNHYWFKAKMYGWGWTPATREGWAVMVVFAGLLLINAYRLGMFEPDQTGVHVSEILFFPSTKQNKTFRV